MSRAQRGRNPYEIRFDTLHLAQSILSENAAARRDANRDIRQDIIEGPNNPDTNENGEAGLYDPHTYTTQDVIDEAKKLYEFIDPPDVKDVLSPTANPDPVLGNAPTATIAHLPGDGLPATHPDAGKRITVLNDPDLHVSLAPKGTPSGTDVFVWFNDRLYKGTMTAQSSKQVQVHGIFPHIRAPEVLNRIEAALSNATRLRGTKVKLRYKDETEFPPLEISPLEATYQQEADGTLVSINILSDSLCIDIKDGQIYLARLRPTSSHTYGIILEPTQGNDDHPLPPNIRTLVIHTVEQHLKNKGQDVTVSFLPNANPKD